MFLFMAMIFSELCMPTEAAEHPGSQSRAVKGHFVDGRIMFDHKAAPQPALHRRDDSASTDTASTTTAAEVAVTSSSSDSSTTPTSLPRAFDGGFGTNFTQPSCPTFLRSMVSNDTFISCVPFSLLLQNSMSFFDATRTPSTITAVLDASCSVFFPACSALMSSLAVTLRSSSACQADYGSENPQVRQAYAGLLAYDVSYAASCLKDPPAAADNHNPNNNSAYCFANAVTNASSPTDSYVYYVPLGIGLPSGSLPTCDACLAATMAVYAAAAPNRTQPLNLDYVASATLINEMCGPAFVNASVPAAAGGAAGGGGGGGSKSAASRAGAAWGAWVGALVGAAAVVAAS
ncbi:hypothetical protein HO173_001185 [Letharia columbiana]|uniref:DUF7729 domain-containing protein n=1 Tax=Letharia columbiana TaxID=112416 RepID=A0A8H6L991_9LECA|nr:uncharacterized protein HO173_001185 [Letharia columbiana]KAF6240517.1 hypothetical protein HO173_001185 [Letharia columbiana]